MKNKLSDLNNHLFMQLERLNEEGLSDEVLTQEIKRTDSIVNLSDKIISNAKLSLDATKLRMEYGTDINGAMPVMIESKKPTRS